METGTKREQPRIPREIQDSFDLDDFTEEDLVIAFKCGIQCLQASRRSLTTKTESQVYEDVRKDFQQEIQCMTDENTQLHNEIEMERELGVRQVRELEARVDVSVDKIVDHKMQVQNRVMQDKNAEIERLGEKLMARAREVVELKEELRQQEAEIRIRVEEKVSDRVQQEVLNKQGEVNDILRKNTELLETVYQSQRAAKAVKSSSEIGEIGEKKFLEIAKNTFLDFEGFDIVDVHNQPHKGDFHLSVKDMTILVDAKAYKRSVDNPQIEKIKEDLRRNSHLHFAWLVSLNTSIDKRNKGLFVFEWISDTQCVVHINNLLALDNKEMVLKTVFYLCREHETTLKTRTDGASEMIALKERQEKISEKANSLKKRMREVKSTIASLKALHEAMETDLANILCSERDNGLGKFYATVVEWWNSKIVESEKSGNGENGESPSPPLKSNLLWNTFKKDLPEEATKNNIQKFKEILQLIVAPEHLTKMNGARGSFEISGFEWKTSGSAENKVVENKNEPGLSTKHIATVINISTESH